MQVGTPQVETAAQYVLKKVVAVADLAKRNPGVHATIEREQTSGGVNAEFAGARVASAYKNLTNIILYLAPSNISSASMPPAVLLNSHFDSVFGSKGAILLERLSSLKSWVKADIAIPQSCLCISLTLTMCAMQSKLTAGSMWL